jgi:uncharacterized protein (TIGR01777 family)
MKILVGGSSGLIGSALLPHLASQGHHVIRLVRGRPARGEDEVAWDPDAGAIDSSRLAGVEAVVNLAGATIARWPWTAAHKRRVLESRVRSTGLLSRAISEPKPTPRVFVSASAIGVYGDRGDEILRETSPPGPGFLPEVCVAWEAAAAPARTAGIRVVTPRFGMVLSGAGGALPALLIPFRLGLGGVIGNGRQYMSWIALEDVVAVIAHAIAREDLSGPLNAVSPAPSTNAEFTKTLGRVLKRPTLLPLPAFAARLVLGGMADALLLSSARVEPAQLLASGFEFRFPELEGALRNAVGAAPPRDG